MKYKPRAHRLTESDRDFLTQLVEGNYDSPGQFWTALFSAITQQPGYRGLPKDEQTVERAWKDWRSGRRSLPRHYWPAVTLRLGVTEDDLRSRHQALTVEAVRQYDAIVTPSFERAK